ncbi:hypothetical protein J1605_018026 [Eschrichtius robustus]|uniref:Uncharacterized protein n=1 Tax=Eschrichtius robustus TaxID=9764 RepID=A0AB34HY03_ESCRO|nr:hypothetical protein J1605_018026 [Eschrichtius robustus]
MVVGDLQPIYELSEENGIIQSVINKKSPAKKLSHAISKSLGCVPTREPPHPVFPEQPEKPLDLANIVLHKWYVNRVLPIHSPWDGHLGCLQISASTYNAAVNASDVSQMELGCRFVVPVVFGVCSQWLSCTLKEMYSREVKTQVSTCKSQQKLYSG